LPNHQDSHHHSPKGTQTPNPKKLHLHTSDWLLSEKIVTRNSILE